MNPERLWYWSIKLHRARIPLLPRLLKGLIFALYHAVLPYECQVGPGLRLLHRGLGTVIHPKTLIGSDVTIAHGVTIAAGSQEPGSSCSVVIENGALIGAHAGIIPRAGAGLRIGAGAKIGMLALVTSDVAPGAIMVQSPAQPKRLQS